MTTSELLSTIRDTLAADVELSQWCQAQFGKAHKVFLGVDDQHPPKAEDYPIVIIVGVDQVRGDDQRELQWTIPLGVGVVNESATEDGNKVTCEGMLQAETLRELAENALYRARIASMGSTGDASSESYHPLYVSYTAITVKQLRTTRKGLP